MTWPLVRVYQEAWNRVTDRTGEQRLVGNQCGRCTYVYHRRPIGWCILAGDTDCGGLDMLIPVLGFTIGIALRIRVAAGWWIFIEDGELWYAAPGTYEGTLELRENREATSCGCWVGEDSGDPLDDERSEDEELMDTNCLQLSDLFLT